MIYYKIAFETTNCLRRAFDTYFHTIPLRHDRQFATPALICFLFDHLVRDNKLNFFTKL
jgi:hypothetical protein